MKTLQKNAFSKLKDVMLKDVAGSGLWCIADTPTAMELYEHLFSLKTSCHRPCG